MRRHVLRPLYGNCTAADGGCQVSGVRSLVSGLFSKEYVGYLAREVAKKLIASGLIETKAVPALNEKVHAALLDELALEDRINDEVRVILEAYSDEMQKAGANYQEMFRKVKTELTKKYKAVL